MFRKIVSGYKNFFLFTAKVAGLVTACIVLGFAIVWPLWKFATGCPRVYTLCVLACLAALILRLVYLTVRQHSAVAVISWILQLAAIAGGCIVSIGFILAGRRIMAVPVLAAAFVLWGLCRFGLRGK